jgi:hypothetical protein
MGVAYVVGSKQDVHVSVFLYNMYKLLKSGLFAFQVHEERLWF